MKNTQKGFIAPLLIAIIAVLVIGSTFFYYKSKNVGLDDASKLSLSTLQQEQVKKIIDNEIVGKTQVSPYSDFTELTRNSLNETTFECNNGLKIGDKIRVVGIYTKTKEINVIWLASKWWPLNSKLACVSFINN